MVKRPELLYNKFILGLSARLKLKKGDHLFGNLSGQLCDHQGLPGGG
jgi:hypothetical protein